MYLAAADKTLALTESKEEKMCYCCIRHKTKGNNAGIPV